MARIDVQFVKHPYAFHHVPNRIPNCVLGNPKLTIKADGHAELHGMDHGLRKRYHQE